ncbi:hypothetical protein ACJMK2_013460 [Sinanodonta woodiana]|uniref:CCHC-type domain-containing protein n=1 Tax=Sinanodonta woodiana TaxID=1069815 RepID=A0ABD3V0W2_SINWO
MLLVSLRRYQLKPLRRPLKVGYKIRTLNVRRETFKATPGVNTGKLIARIDSRDAPKVPEFFKVRGLLVQTWYFGCFQHRPCPNCNQIGHTRSNCKKSAAQNVNTPTGDPDPGPSTSNPENVSYARALAPRRNLFATIELEQEQEQENNPAANEWRVQGKKKRDKTELWMHRKKCKWKSL